MNIKTISARDLKNKLDKDEVLLIDVREPAEHQSECIDVACLTPLGEVSQEKLPSKSRPIVIHCRSGKRSEEACRRLLAQDPTLDLYSLEGGIVAWMQEGYNVKKSGRNVLPLDRQTQLAAGVFILTGVLMGHYIHPIFYYLPAVAGIGLMVAGLTGWCGMSQLLARMPWNQ